MKILFKSAKIINPGSPLHGKKRDVLIETGKGEVKATIKTIAAQITDTKAEVVTAKGLCISPSWIDMAARFGDPGFEYKEDLQSGLDAAEKGGFGGVVLYPGSQPVVDHKSAVEYILSKSQHSSVDVYPCGALSDKMQGKQLSEMYDMKQAGAVAFTDDKHHVSTELMTRALEYAQNVEALIIAFPYDQGVNVRGLMHEGPASVSLGLQGIPSIAEELRLQRDIELLKYTGGRLHVSTISTAKSAEHVRKAKKDKLAISCGVAAHQFSFLDEDLASYDTNLKVLPPFRRKEDRKALVNALKDGTIDVICSDHTPEDIEHKVREFEDANYGISAIETAFCAVWTALRKEVEIEDIATKFFYGPEDVLGMTHRVIEEGYDQGLTVFATEESTEFTNADWASKSKNSPFLGKKLDGRVIAVV